MISSKSKRISRGSRQEFRISKRLNTVIQIAKGAGNILLCHYGKTREQCKGVGYSAETLFTDADLQSERMIVEELKKHFPSYGIYAEEEHRENLDAPFVWYVDPLDGTSNFSRNIPLFGISIGLAYKNKPVAGVIYFPVLNIVLHAEQSSGAWGNNKRIFVSRRTLARSLYCADGDYKKSLVGKVIQEKCGLVKIIGASSYEFAKLAMGDADIYIRHNSPHDVVAGIAILEEAGGRVTDEKGDDWTLDSKIVVASNGFVHKQVLKLLNQAN